MQLNVRNLEYIIAFNKIIEPIGCNHYIQSL